MSVWLMLCATRFVTSCYSSGVTIFPTPFRLAPSLGVTHAEFMEKLYGC